MTLQWLDHVDAEDMFAELDVGRPNMTATGAVMEHFGLDHANDVKARGDEFD